MNKRSNIPMGSLSATQQNLYIKRKGDDEALSYIQKGDYLMVIEPRQQGKTSLINALKCSPALTHMDIAYIYAAELRQESEQVWYQDLAQHLLEQIALPPKEASGEVRNSKEWRDFLSRLGQFARQRNRRIIIVLDEIGAIHFPGATLFFSVLRGIYNARLAQPMFDAISFVLEGTFSPHNLISDPAISPFNVAQHIHLDDFTVAEVTELVERHGWKGNQARELAEVIHDWTDGQPYLCQFLCGHVGPDGTRTDVERAVQKLRNDDRSHIPPLREGLHSALLSDDDMRKHLAEVAKGKRVKYFPAGTRWQEKLELLGIIKGEGEEETYCKIRNRIYQEVVNSLLSELETQAPKPSPKEIVAPTKSKTPHPKTSQPRRVFISSTWEDLRLEREAVEKALLRMGETDFVGMEYFGSRPETPKKVSLAEVDRSNVYIGIFAHRYGSGITEAEYKRSRKRKMRCLIYIKDEDAPIPPKFMEKDSTKVTKLAALKKRLKEKHVFSVFSTPEQLATLVVADLHKLLKTRSKRG